MTYPLERMERVALRAELLRKVVAKAEKAAFRNSLSVRCSGGQWSTYIPMHAGDDGGCPDDGTGCLCECHDQGA